MEWRIASSVIPQNPMGRGAGHDYNRGMSVVALLAEVTNSVSPGTMIPRTPGFLGRFGIMLLPLLAVSGTMLMVILDRYLVYHRERINLAEFLAGVRNVLRRDNVVEAVSICDATPGPVARLVKAAVLARDGGRERVIEAMEEVGMTEVPRLEARLNVLATIGQIAPMIGLLGTLFGFIGVFEDLQRSGGFAASASLFHHLWQALYSAAGGLAIAIVSQTAYNFLVGRVNAIALDMEKASAEAIRLVTDNPGSRKP
jgi:biopolymer transport protein ExbB